eukprot:1689532-Rhodomonas_salina.1
MLHARDSDSIQEVYKRWDNMKKHLPKDMRNSDWGVAREQIQERQEDYDVRQRLREQRKREFGVWRAGLGLGLPGPQAEEIENPWEG